MNDTPSELPGALEAPVARARPSARARLRTYFLTGLIVAGPLAITLYITWWFINLVDGWMKPLVPARYSPDTYLPFPCPASASSIAFVGLTLLGFLTASLVGKSLLNLGEVLLARMPVVRSIYKGVKQIFETVFKQDGQSFRQVGLIEWPGEGLWSLCFITEPAAGALAEALPPAEHLCVFVPCTPNPTTGYLVIMERARVKEVDLTPDDAFKLLMSMGIIQPESRLAPAGGRPAGGCAAAAAPDGGCVIPPLPACGERRTRQSRAGEGPGERRPSAGSYSPGPSPQPSPPQAGRGSYPALNNRTAASRSNR